MPIVTRTFMEWVPEKSKIMTAAVLCMVHPFLGQLIHVSLSHHHRACFVRYHIFSDILCAPCRCLEKLSQSNKFTLPDHLFFAEALSLEAILLTASFLLAKTLFQRANRLPAGFFRIGLILGATSYSRSARSSFSFFERPSKSVLISD
jgi:hypothetical protein